MNRRVILAGAVAGALAACSSATPTGPDIPAGATVAKTFHPPAQTTYSGRATAVEATVKLLFTSLTTRLGDTGPLPSDGGSLQASLLTATIPGLVSAGVAQGSTAGGNDDASSSASLANVSLTVGGIGISAALLSSQTDANCFGGPPSLTGSSVVTALAIDGQAVVVTGQPNQTISLLGGLVRVVINEQSQTLNSIDVSALHVSAIGAADVVIARTHSDITCGG